MLQSLIHKSGNLILEIISFLLVLPVLLLSCIALLATGKSRAFVFWKRKEKPEEERVEVAVEMGRN